MSTDDITCPECHGSGLLYSHTDDEIDVCHRCDGYGMISRTIGNEKLTRTELNENNQSNNP